MYLRVRDYQSTDTRGRYCGWLCIWQWSKIQHGCVLTSNRTINIRSSRLAEILGEFEDGTDEYGGFSERNLDDDKSGFSEVCGLLTYEKIAVVVH